MTKRLVSSIGIVALFISAGQLRADAPAEKSQNTIAAVLEPFVQSHTLAGAVTAVASPDKILDIESVGYADITARTPMKNDDLFWIASMSKPMTAAAMMMLVDEGKVNVDDPVEKYLPEFKGQMAIGERSGDQLILKNTVHPITVTEVLSHTSGLPFMSRVEQHIDTMPLRYAVMSYALSPLQTQPDVKYAYSNAGINTAGRIIEVVSGMPYEQFMQKRLFDPLGMKDTTFWPNAEQQTRLAKSYKPNAAKTDLEEITVSQLSYPLGDHEKRFPCPAGGLFSTAADTARFGQLILSGGTFDGKRLISESSVRLMSSTHTGTLQSKDGEKGYGFGLSTSHKLHGDSDPSPNGACGHGGAYATNLQIDPEHHLVLVYMVQHAGYANKDGGAIYPAFQKAATAAFGAQR